MQIISEKIIIFKKADIRVRIVYGDCDKSDIGIKCSVILDDAFENYKMYRIECNFDQALLISNIASELTDDNRAVTIRIEYDNVGLNHGFAKMNKFHMTEQCNVYAKGVSLV